MTWLQRKTLVQSAGVTRVRVLVARRLSQRHRQTGRQAPLQLRPSNLNTTRYPKKANTHDSREAALDMILGIARERRIGLPQAR